MRNPENRMVEGLVAHRCPGCRLLVTACLCDLIPCVVTRTRVLVENPMELYGFGADERITR